MDILDGDGQSFRVAAGRMCARCSYGEQQGYHEQQCWLDLESQVSPVEADWGKELETSEASGRTPGATSPLIGSRWRGGATDGPSLQIPLLLPVYSRGFLSQGVGTILVLKPGSDS
jgi:hypothetical protein